MNRGALELGKFFQSQSEAAQRIGVDPSTFSLLLASKRRPSIEVAAAIERQYGVPCIAWTEEFWDPPQAVDARNPSAVSELDHE